ESTKYKSMDQENVDFSDVEKFLLIQYKKCPIHKRQIAYLRLDDKQDPQVVKCQKCLDENKFKIFIDIYELFQSSDYQIFQKWPIHDDDRISERLEQMKQWSLAQYLDEINLIFDEIVEKIQSKRKEILKDLGQVQENYQKCLNYYQQISQKEKLAEIIKSQFGDKKKQNEMILSIIKETDIKNMKDEVLSSISMLNIFESQQDEYNNYQNLEEITIYKLEDLDKCYNFKKIKFDNERYPDVDEYLGECQQTLERCTNIDELQFDFSYCDIQDEGAIIISESIIKLKLLSKIHLRLNKNSLSAKGVLHISRSINNIEKINHLGYNFEENNIGSEGFCYLANQLQQCQNLKTLHLAFQYVFNLKIFIHQILFYKNSKVVYEFELWYCLAYCQNNLRIQQSF
ncbi:hypothetical protein ABPG74_008070, partial [Tetrahymena malaccensis]